MPSKCLTDDGFGLLADGLQNALTTCPDLALVDLILSDNALTTRSLARLAPIIQKSRYNLQALDLSNNNFQVSTVTEAQEWEQFLQSFRSCMTLRRLDLSNNTLLGPRAFEILARVYSREPPVVPLPATGYQSLITLPDDASTYGISSPDLAIRQGNAPHLPVCANGKTLADPWVLNYRCGLRSIPYLTFTNVGLNDTGALFLSYVLEQHYYPIQLVTETNATEATSVIRTYRQDANTKGIDWEQNTQTLSKDGLHLLQAAEKLRKKMLLEDTDSMTSSYLSTSQVDVHDALSGCVKWMFVSLNKADDATENIRTQAVVAPAYAQCLLSTTASTTDQTSTVPARKSNATRLYILDAIVLNFGRHHSTPSYSLGRYSCWRPCFSNFSLSTPAIMSTAMSARSILSMRTWPPLRTMVSAML